MSSFGFRKEEVERFDAATATTSPPTLGLTNRIHPIFFKYRFSSIGSSLVRDAPGGLLTDAGAIDWDQHPLDVATYHRLYPALQLATLMLEQSFESWWCKLLMARRFKQERIPSATTPSSGSKVFLDGNYVSNASDVSTAWDIFNHKITPCVHFCFENKSAQNDQSFGTTFALVGGPPRKAIVDLSDAYLRYEGHLAGTYDGSALLRSLFCLAVTIIHELAHAAEAVLASSSNVGRTACGGVVTRDEPFFDRKHPVAELGRAWEQHMFAGGLHGFDANPIGTSGHYWWPWRCKKTLFTYVRQINDHSLERLFLDETWRHGLRNFEFTLGPPMAMVAIFTNSAAYGRLFDQSLVCTNDNVNGMDEYNVINFDYSLKSLGGKQNALLL